MRGDRESRQEEETGPGGAGVWRWWWRTRAVAVTSPVRRQEAALPAHLPERQPHPGVPHRHRPGGDPGAGAAGINKVERAIGEHGIAQGLTLRKLTDETQPQRVAIVGAGPSGLSCA